MAKNRTTAAGEGGDLNRNLTDLSGRRISPLELLPHEDLREKLVDLVLNGQPRGCDQQTAALFSQLRKSLVEHSVDETKVVVFGGGTGLSNLIGGDSRRDTWPRRPFSGLKDRFADEGPAPGRPRRPPPCPPLVDPA